MLPLATGNAVAGHIWPAGRYLPAPDLQDSRDQSNGLTRQDLQGFEWILRWTLQNFEITLQLFENNPATNRESEVKDTAGFRENIPPRHSRSHPSPPWSAAFPAIPRSARSFSAAVVEIAGHSATDKNMHVFTGVVGGKVRFSFKHDTHEHVLRCREGVKPRTLTWSLLFDKTSLKQCLATTKTMKKQRLATAKTKNAAAINTGVRRKTTVTNKQLTRCLPKPLTPVSACWNFPVPAQAACAFPSPGRQQQAA